MTSDEQEEITIYNFTLNLNFVELDTVVEARNNQTTLF